MSYLVIARKYRPKNFEEMVGQKPVVQTLMNAVKANRVAQAYLFSGMRGVGKTSAARIFAKALNCQFGPTPTPCNKCEFCIAINEDRSIDVLEIDGASNRGVEEIGNIRDAAKYKPIHSRYKVIIIDEVHMLTTHAFNALLKTLEEPPPRTVFIFATTEFHKVPATIVSRCQHFEFKKISHKDIVNHLLDITKKESITISPYGLSLIAESTDGSLRDAQSLLDQAVALSGNEVNDEDLKEILGTMSKDILFAFSSAILDQRPAEIFTLVERVIAHGYDLRFFTKELVQHFRNLLLVRSAENAADLLPLNKEEMSRLKEEAGKASAEDFLRYLLALQNGEQGLRYSSHPQVTLETLLVRLCLFRSLIPFQELLEDIREMKAGTSPAEEPARKSQPTERRAPGQKREDPVSGPPSPSPSPPSPSAAQRSISPKELMARTLKALEEKKSSLAAILGQYSSFRLRDESMDILFDSEKRFVISSPVTLEVFIPKGKRDFIEVVQKDTKLLEKIASEVSGLRVKLKLTEETVPDEAFDTPPENEKETALKDTGVQRFMDTFKAKIVSVEPVKRQKDRK